MSKWHYLYNNSKWVRLRELVLKEQPLCVICRQHNEVKASDTVDHITPHKGNKELFWDRQNLQALCSSCHNTIKREIETKGYYTAFNEEGWPVSSEHPINKTR
jgi:5-methylcytosine-specific restriction protein A